MEEPLFENDFVLREDLYREAAGKTISRWYRVLCYAFAGVLFALAAGTALLAYRRLLSSAWYALFFLALGVFLIVWIGKIVPSIAVRRRYRQQMVITGGQPLRIVTRIYEDHLETDAQQGRAVSIPYDKLRRVCETPRLYIVLFEAHVMAVLQKDAFTKGAGGQAYAFLQSKAGR